MKIPIMLIIGELHTGENNGPAIVVLSIILSMLIYVMLASLYESWQESRKREVKNRRKEFAQEVKE